jgi:hypothetical protein
VKRPVIPKAGAAGVVFTISGFPAFERRSLKQSQTIPMSVIAKAMRALAEIMLMKRAITCRNASDAMSNCREIIWSSIKYLADSRCRVRKSHSKPN